MNNFMERMHGLTWNISFCTVCLKVPSSELFMFKIFRKKVHFSYKKPHPKYHPPCEQHHLKMVDEVGLNYYGWNLLFFLVFTVSVLLVRNFWNWLFKVLIWLLSARHFFQNFMWQAAAFIYFLVSFHKHLNE